MDLSDAGVGGSSESSQMLPVTSLCCPFPLLLSGTRWGPAKGTVRSGREDISLFQETLVRSLCTWDESLAYLPLSHTPESASKQHVAAVSSVYLNPLSHLLLKCLFLHILISPRSTPETAERCN